MAIDTVDKRVAFTDRQGLWDKIALADVPGGTPDGVFYIQVGSEYFTKIIDGSVRASQCGIYANGTNMSAKIQAALNHPSVYELIFDIYNADVTMTGTVSVPSEKVLVFKNKCKIIGNGTFTGAFIVDCDYRKQCFGTSLNLPNTLLNTRISTMWFGAKSDYLPPTVGGSIVWTNNSPIVQKTIAAARPYLDGGTLYNYSVDIYTPASQTLNATYRCDSQIPLNALMHFTGDGKERTTFCFPNSLGVPGLKVVYPYSGTKGSTPNLRISDFTVRTVNGACNTVYDDASHGIYFTTTSSIMERVTVLGFNGHGIFVEGNAPASNANNCRIRDCDSQINAGSGILMDGADANNILIDGGYYNYNGRCGVHDSSFLGCGGIMVHTATNGRSNYFNRSAVSWNGTGTGTTGWKEYECIQDCGPGTPAGVIEPGVTAGWQNYWAYWRDITVAPYFDADLPNLNAGPIKKWNNSTNWVTTAGFYIDDTNNLGGWFACYAEQDQIVCVNRGNPNLFGGFLAHSGANGSVTSYGGVITMNAWQSIPPASLNSLFASSVKTNHTTNGSGIGMFNGTTGQASGWFMLNNGTCVFSNGIDGADGGGVVMRHILPGSTYPNVFDGMSGVPANGALTYPKPTWHVVDQDIGHMTGVTFGTHPPTSGEWGAGSRCWNTSVFKRGILGWICYISGTPGTWVPIGFADENLIDAATVATDANRATTLTLTLGANRTMGAPTNANPGQRLRYRLIQDNTGGRTVTWASGTGGFKFPGGTAPTLTTTANRWDYLDFEYNERSATWDYQGGRFDFAP
jgi:hypothetical protein